MKLLHSSIVIEYKNTVTPTKVVNLQPHPYARPKQHCHGTHEGYGHNLEQINQYFCIHILYINKISSETHPSLFCPLCNSQKYNTAHLFNCPYINWNTFGSPESLGRSLWGCGSILALVKIAEWRRGFGAQVG